MILFTNLVVGYDHCHAFAILTEDIGAKPIPKIYVIKVVGKNIHCSN